MTKILQEFSEKTNKKNKESPFEKVLVGFMKVNHDCYKTPTLDVSRKESLRIPELFKVHIKLSLNIVISSIFTYRVSYDFSFNIFSISRFNM
jgi:hypothetical protein